MQISKVHQYNRSEINIHTNSFECQFFTTPIKITTQQCLKDFISLNMYNFLLRNYLLMNLYKY